MAEGIYLTVLYFLETVLLQKQTTAPGKRAKGSMCFNNLAVTYYILNLNIKVIC